MARTYWAATEDPDELTEEVRTRIKDFYHYLRQTALLYRVIRNWRFYHGIFVGRWGEGLNQPIKELGEQGEYAFLASNHFRNLIQHLLTLTTQNRPAFETLAVNTDSKSLEQARLGDQLLEYYLSDQRVEVFLKDAVEQSLIFTGGYIATVWDETAGKAYAADAMTEQLYHEGDLRVRSYNLFDVPYDPRARNWRDKGWCCIRDRVSRWDLIAQFPEVEEKLATDHEKFDDQEIEFIRNWDYGTEDDYIDRWTFFHERTEALPYGRTVQFAGGTALPGSDGNLPYRRIPVDRVAPGEFLQTSFGYTPAFDLQGLPQALNAEISSICTNHRAFGVQNVWVRTGSNLSVDEIEGGLNLVQSLEKPEPLQLTATAQEVFVFLDKLMEQMEYLSGVNSVARGQPEASLKSGSALALIDSKAVQFASSLIHSYYMLIEDVGTSMLRVLTDFASRERVVTIQGKQNGLIAQRVFSGGDLQLIDRVRVHSGNSLSRTLAGRTDMAKELLQSQMLKTPEEFFNVIETGRRELLYQSERSQLNVIHEENEQLLAGQPARALISDNHVVHIREHTPVLNTTELRQLPGVTDAVLAHIQEHFQLLMQPATQQIMAVLGYQTILPPIAPQDQPLPTSPRASPGLQGAEAMGRRRDNGTNANEPAQLPEMPRMPNEGAA